MNIEISSLLSPPAEFSPFPFWFLNGDLDKDEIERQLTDFAAKGINGVVLHPRIGISKEIEYLSDEFMDRMRHAVKVCARLDMKCLLYDEGMYPSGSAHGLVVKQNPAFAAKGLRRIPAGEPPKPGELLVLSAGGYEFYSGFTGGTIRGIHEGEDDGQPGAPAAGDLLSFDAMQAFIHLTHDRYFECMGEEFGKTVIGFFTDEPSPTGRCVPRGILPWTDGLYEELKAAGFTDDMFPAVFEEGFSEEKRLYNNCVTDRLRRTYYRPISEWCTAHGIVLAGHPHGPMDFAVLEDFGIPGQDIVWRWVAPENGLAVSGAESAQAKCAADVAHHMGRPRNLNECFGCCGKGGEQWAFNVDDMKWYLDWLFVRGCNFIIPHAFYFDATTKLRRDRPPEVGPHNIWWEEYRQISTYIKRMCMLNYGYARNARVGVLGTCDQLPVDLVRPLYENQVEFEYITDELLIKRGVNYEAVLTDTALKYDARALELLKGVKSQIEPAEYACVKLSGDHSQIRAALLNHSNTRALMLVNEGDSDYTGEIVLPFEGDITAFDPWNGRLYRFEGNKIYLGRRESMVLFDGLPVDGLPEYALPCVYSSVLTPDIYLTLPSGTLLKNPGDWQNIPELGVFSGSLDYICEFEAAEGETLLDLGDVREQAEIFVNGERLCTLLRPPYRVQIGGLLKPGKNRLKIRVTNSPVSKYEHKPYPSGILGQITIQQNPTKLQQI